MPSKYNTKSCEFYSLFGLKESWFFDRSEEYMEKQRIHSSYVQTTRLENPTTEQMTELKLFMYELCGNCFATHLTFPTTAEDQQYLFRGVEAYFSLNKIHELLGFLPNNDILLKVLAEECMKFTEPNFVFPFVDPQNNYYLFYKEGRIEHENNLILTIAMEKLKMPKKKLFGLF